MWMIKPQQAYSFNTSLCSFNITYPILSIAPGKICVITGQIVLGAEPHHQTNTDLPLKDLNCIHVVLSCTVRNLLSSEYKPSPLAALGSVCGPLPSGTAHPLHREKQGDREETHEQCSTTWAENRENGEPQEKQNKKNFETRKRLNEECNREETERPRLATPMQ